MERVQQVYKVTLLDETYLLSTEKFTQFQKECREIAFYGKLQFPNYGKNEEEWANAEETYLEPEQLEPSAEQRLEQVEVQPLIEETETKNWIKVLDEVVEKEVVVKPTIKVHSDKLKDLINTMPKTAKIAKDTKIQKYVKMHEAGVDMLAIKNSMIKDKVCAESSIPYFVKKILAASIKVTKVTEYEGLTDDQIIDGLIQKNKDTAADRQKPKLAVE